MASKTAVTQLIDWIESKAVSDIMGNTIFSVSTTEINSKLRELLDLEKQQLVQAAMWLPAPFKTIEFLPELGEEYYNKIYNYEK